MLQKRTSRIVTPNAIYQQKVRITCPSKSKAPLNEDNLVKKSLKKPGRPEQFTDNERIIQVVNENNKKCWGEICEILCHEYEIDIHPEKLVKICH